MKNRLTEADLARAQCRGLALQLQDARDAYRQAIGYVRQRRLGRKRIWLKVRIADLHGIAQALGIPSEETEAIE